VQIAVGVITFNENAAERTQVRPATVLTHELQNVPLDSTHHHYAARTDAVSCKAQLLLLLLLLLLTDTSSLVPAQPSDCADRLFLM